MKLFRTILLPVLLFGVALSGWAADFSGWSKAMPVTFTGYSRPETLTNFPVLVTLSTSLPGFSYADFASPVDGADLRFSADNQTNELAYEIEKWDTSGTSFVWVKVPVLAGTNTQIWAFWGNPGATAPAYATNGLAWDVNEIGVWHMAQASALDSTTNRFHGSASGTVTQVSSGVIDGADDFDADLDWVQVPDSTRFTLSAAYTVSAWIRPDPLTNDMQAFIGTYSGGNNGFIFTIATNADNRLQFWAGGAWRTNSVGVPDGVWSHVAYSRNGTAGRFYVNGMLTTNIANAVAGGDGGPLQIGAGGTNWPSQRFDGQVDEVRLTGAERSSNWMWAAWMNTASNAVFGTAGNAGAFTLSLQAMGAAPFGSIDATLNGKLLKYGGGEVYICWDSTDKGVTSTGSWSHVEYVGNSFTNGQVFGAAVNGLLSGSTYVYRCYATNLSETAWSAPAQSFRTVYVPAVTNLGPVNGNATSWMRGQITDSGLDTPSVWFSWWAVGGATTNIVPMGPTSGVFSNAVGVLTPFVTYQYSILASNLAGSAWSTASNFLTLITYPGVTNTGALPLSPYAEKLQGAVTNTGGDAPQVWFLYWLDGGTLTNAYGVGAQTGACNAQVSGLLPGSNYVFMLMASNRAGAVYSRTNGFVTTLETVYYVVTNGNNSADGLTWGTAVSNIEVAVQRAGLCTGTVVVGDGRFAVTSLWMTITNAITVRSLNGPVATTLRAAYMNSSNRRVLLLNNTNAVVAGFTMTDGALVNISDSPSGMRLLAGTVSNCIIRGNVGGDNAGGVDMQGGLLTRCTISGNQAYRGNNTGVGYGGGIWVQGGVVQFCTISNNFAAVGGCGLRLSGGTVRDSQILGNNQNYGSLAQGAGVYMTGGTLERCVVRSNMNAGTAGGVYLAGNGVVRNCLIADNTALYNGGGIFMTTGRVQNVTLTGNRADAVAPGLYMTAGWVSNTVVYGNGTARYPSLAAEVFKSGGTFSYGCALPLLAGPNNVAADPIFLNPTAGDFRLSPGSPCIDAGAALADVADDLIGAARPQDGNADGTAAYDMGTYEAGPLAGGPFSCSFDATPAEGYLTVNATFTAFAAGANTNITWYGWDFENDGIIDDAGVGKRVTTHTFGAGYYDVSLTVSNTDGATASVVRQACIRVAPATSYVWKLGSHTAPYDTWAKAATSIQSAVDAAWSSDTTPTTVLVTNGVYTNSIVLSLVRPLILRSVNGPAATTVTVGGVAGRRVFYVSATNAWLEGFTATGGYTADGAGGILLDGGTITNCLITGCIAQLGGGMWVKNGLAVKCRIVANKTGINLGQGPGLYLTGGIVRDSESVSNNASPNNITGGGVYMTGGLLERCRIQGNIAGSSGNEKGFGGGIYMTGGTGLSCVVVGNTQYGDGGGAYLAGGVLRNCLVYSNSAPKHTGGGLYMTGTTARVENCTVSDNSAYLNNGNGLYQAGGAVTNSIFFFNAATPNVIQVSGSIGFSCMDPLVTGVGNTNADPFFVNRSAGNYRLGAGLACIDSGTNLDWVGTATDLDGSNRLQNAVVDMGAYESAAAGAGPLQCNFAAVPYLGLLSLTPAFTATVTGGNTNIVWYRWEYGDGATDQSAGLDTTTHTYGPGFYTVTLTVRNTDDEEASSVRTAYIRVAPETAYVAKGGSNVPPYLTWATAASNVEDAVDIGPLNVLVSNGTYNSTKTILISQDMSVRSVNGPVVTVVNAGNVSDRRVVQIAATNAWLEGFTLTGGLVAYAGGGGILQDGGIVTNCYITGSSCYQNGGGVWIKNGLLVGCRVYGNRSGAAIGLAPGVYITGGAVRDCAIVSNSLTSAGTIIGAGVYMTAGSLERSLIEKNVAGMAGYTNSPGGGLYMSGGTGTACVISGNTAWGNGGGAYLDGGLLRNCLVASSNTSKINGGGLYLAGGAARVENATVCNNAATNLGGGVYLAAGSLTNTIVYFNELTNVYQTGGSIGYSCMTPLVAGDGNTDADPGLKNAFTGNYHLLSGSPCIDAGTNLTWSAAGTDLDGNPRQVRGRVDMGVFESFAPRGTVIFIR